MNDKKLRIAFIGTLVGAFVLIVAMVLVWKFRFYDPVLSELNTTNEKYDKQKTEADKLDVSLKSALLAQQRLDLAAGELDYFRRRFRSLPMDLTESPIVGQGPRNATFVRLLEEYSSGFGLAAVSQLKRAADESGVVINSKIAVQVPPQNPEQVVAPASGILKPPTEALSVTVTGTLDSVLQFFQIINKSEILMVIGNVATTSDNKTFPSPVTATFTITPYLLVSGPSATQAAIPGIENAQLGAATTAPGAGATGAGTTGLGAPNAIGGPAGTSGPGGLGENGP